MRPEAAVALIVLSATLVVATGCASGSRTSASLDSGGQTSAVAQRAINMAKVLLARGDATGALAEAETAVRLEPRSGLAHAVLANALESLDRDEDAAREYRRAVALAPNSGVVLNAHGTFLCRSGHTDEAMTAFLKATADGSYREPEQALANAGSCAADAGRIDVAELNFRAVLALDAGHAQALVGMAKLEHQRGDALGARAFLQRREALAPLGPGELALAIEIETAAGDARAASRYRSTLAALVEQAGTARPTVSGSRTQ